MDEWQQQLLDACSDNNIQQVLLVWAEDDNK